MPDIKVSMQFSAEKFYLRRFQHHDMRGLEREMLHSQILDASREAICMEISHSYEYQEQRTLDTSHQLFESITLNLHS